MSPVGAGRRLKRDLRGLLAADRLARIEQLARGERGVLGALLTLTFDRDPVVAWRAVEATGVAAARIAEDDPAHVREHLRRLFWLLTEESGGVCWRAPEAMAEIVSRRPDLFADYAPIVSHLLLEMAEEDLGHFRPGILWAIGRLGPLAADVGEDVLRAVEDALAHADAAVRGRAAWCLGRLGRLGALIRRRDLVADAGAVEMFEDGVLRVTTVGALVERALGAGLLVR